MHNILFAALMLFALDSSAQQWIQYDIDSGMTVSIPKDYQLIDTMGQRVLKAQIDNGLILVLRMANEGKTAVTVESEQGLVQFYHNFRKGFIESQQGELIDEETFDSNGLKLTRFSYRATMVNEKQIRHCLALFVNETIYALNFWELESMAHELDATREKFYDSIILPAGLTIQDQMSRHPEGPYAYRVGYLLGKIIFLGLVVGVIVLLITRFSGRKKASS